MIHKISDIKINEAKKLRAEGKTYECISQELSISLSTAYAHTMGTKLINADNAIRESHVPLATEYRHFFKNHLKSIPKTNFKYKKVSTINGKLVIEVKKEFDDFDDRFVVSVLEDFINICLKNIDKFPKNYEVKSEELIVKGSDMEYCIEPLSMYAKAFMQSYLKPMLKRESVTGQ